jgi:hypothetical protein
MWTQLWTKECARHSLKECDRLNEACGRKGRCENGVEDGGEVQGVNGRGTGGSNNGPTVRKTSIVLGQRAVMKSAGVFQCCFFKCTLS